jgi:DNA-binding SARP family transcriptional activator
MAERPYQQGLAAIQLLGMFRLAGADGVPIAIQGRRARAVLSYLILAPGQTASRDRLAGLFWGDRGDAQARASLRQCLLEVKGALADAGADALVATREAVTLSPGVLRCDVIETMEGLAHAEPGDALKLIEGAVNARLLEDLELGGTFRDWLDEARAQFDAALAAGVAAQFERLEHRGDNAGVIALASTWLRRDPFDENAVAAVLRAEVASGARAAAQRRYQAFKALLKTELGVTPGEAVEAAVGAGTAPKSVPSASAPANDEPLLAILAFDNLSPDPEIGYFSEGISEEILQIVARNTAIKVIARASSFQFRGRDKVTATISARLGATHFLDGAVRRSGSAVRVSAALVECISQTTLWSGRFDGDLADIFKVQDEIAEAVAHGLETVFSARPSAPDIDPFVYDRYLRARSLSGSPIDVADCIALLEGVTADAPDFASAWASLAMARAVETRWTVEPDAYPASRARALRVAERAAALDPGAGLPLVALSLLEDERNFAIREGLLNRALAASPNDAEILKHAADFAASVGRIAECRELNLRAAALDPMNAQISFNAAVALADMGELDSAFDEFEGICERWPDFTWGRPGPLAIAAVNRAWDRFERFVDPARADEPYYANAMQVAGLMRAPPDEARESLLAAIARQKQTGGSIRLAPLQHLASLGFADACFAIVDAHDGASLGGGIHMLWIIFGATGVVMRTDPRFLDLCAKLGLADYWLTTGRWPDCAGAVDYDFRAEASRASRALSAKPEEVAA